MSMCGLERAACMSLTLNAMAPLHFSAGTPFWNLLTMTPIKTPDGKLSKYVGVQVDVTSKTEGKATTADKSGLPLLVRYDHRLRDNVAKKIVDEVNQTVETAEPEYRPNIGKATKQFPRVALDLATTVERIQQNFCICDPTLPDCPIVFASDAFLDLTEYKREEVLGRNCRFLQGAGTDPETVTQIRNAVKSGAELTVRILNYTKTGRPFWNMFTLAPMRDSDGHTRFYVGVQVDVTAQAPLGSNQVPTWPKTASAEGANAEMGHQAASMIGSAVLGMAGGKGEDPWAGLMGTVMRKKPHKLDDPAYKQLLKTQEQDGQLKLLHFRRVKQLGAGDVGLVDLVQLQVTRGGRSLSRIVEGRRFGLKGCKSNRSTKSLFAGVEHE